MGLTLSNRPLGIFLFSGVLQKRQEIGWYLNNSKRHEKQKKAAENVIIFQRLKAVGKVIFPGRSSQAPAHVLVFFDQSKYQEKHFSWQLENCLESVDFF